MPGFVHVYTDLLHCEFSPGTTSSILEDRHVVSVIKANLNQLPLDECRQRFGARLGVVKLVQRIEDADICFLPKVWDFYLRAGKLGLAQAFARRAEECGKLVVVWNGGDLESVVPFANAVTFFHGPHRSCRRAYRRTFAIPQFKDDWLQIYYDGRQNPRKWSDVPSVGFCGLACQWNSRTLLRAAVTQLQQAVHTVGRARYVPSSMPPPVVLRMRILRRLAKERRLKTNFIVRERYRGGIQGAETNNALAPAKLEFVKNIWESDYTLCVRGVGNFSARFYETLCLGRIPIFVNTNCVLPYDFKVRYVDYCVWIEENEIEQLPSKLLEFHARQTPGTFQERQLNCRRLWEDYLSVTGFYRHFPEHFQGESLL